MEGKTEKKSVFSSILNNSLLTAVAVGLLTSLFAPYIIEKTRERSSLIQQEKEKQDKITQTQFEIVERLNSLLWNYRTSAVFVVMDFLNGEANRDVVSKHLKNYQEVSEITDKELPAQAFKAKMYFDDSDLYSKLFALWSEISILDGQIVEQLNSQEYIPKPKGNHQDSKWEQIKYNLDERTGEMGAVLDELFMKVGKKPSQSNAASNNAFQPTLNHVASGVRHKVNSVITMKAYEEIVGFIVRGTTPNNVAAFRPSEKTKELVADLIHREKTNGLSSEEESELNHYLQLEHLMRLAKTRARQHLANG